MNPLPAVERRVVIALVRSCFSRISHRGTATSDSGPVAVSAWCLPRKPYGST